MTKLKYILLGIALGLILALILAWIAQQGGPGYPA